MAEDDSAEKVFDPTPRKLEQARRKGEVAKSNDVSTAAAYAGLFAAMAIGGSALAGSVLGPLKAFIDFPDRILGLWLDAPLQPALHGLPLALIEPTLLIFGLPALFALVSLMAQQALVFAPTKLTPKLNRISPISNAKNKFGRSGLFEFAKSTVKLVIYASALAIYLRANMQQILGALFLQPAGIAALLGKLSLGFLIVTLLITSCVGLIDYAWQRAEHLRKNRMTLKEMRDEMKESEGDPHFKQARRSRAQEIATNHMLADVPEAQVIVVNPTHYAVALRWNREKDPAPVVVAKGVDDIAAKIRDVAIANSVPIHSDPPTARQLHADVDLGQAIPFELYRPIAAAIRFADNMRRIRKAGWQS